MDAFYNNFSNHLRSPKWGFGCKWAGVREKENLNSTLQGPHGPAGERNNKSMENKTIN